MSPSLRELQRLLCAGQVEGGHGEVRVLDVRHEALQLDTQVEQALLAGLDALRHRAELAEAQEQVRLRAVELAQPPAHSVDHHVAVDPLAVAEVVHGALEGVEEVRRTGERHPLARRAHEARRVDVNHAARRRIDELQVRLGGA